MSSPIRYRNDACRNARWKTFPRIERSGHEQVGLVLRRTGRQGRRDLLVSVSFGFIAAACASSKRPRLRPRQRGQTAAGCSPDDSAAAGGTPGSATPLSRRPPAAGAPPAAAGAAAPWTRRSRRWHAGPAAATTAAVMPAAPAPLISGDRPSPDPRVGLKAGYWMRPKRRGTSVVSQRRRRTREQRSNASDLAFTGNTCSGQLQRLPIIDMSNAAKPSSPHGLAVRHRRTMYPSTKPALPVV